MNPGSAIVVEIAPLEPFLAGLACVHMPRGSTLEQALELLGVAPPHDVAVAIRGRPAAAAQVLHSGDRIEFTRPLAVDPKAARRARVSSERRRSERR